MSRGRNPNQYHSNVAIKPEEVITLLKSQLPVARKDLEHLENIIAAVEPDTDIDEFVVEHAAFFQEATPRVELFSKQVAALGKHIGPSAVALSKHGYSLPCEFRVLRDQV